MKIVLGLSGGVDSAVSARLLMDQGWEVYGLHLDNGAPGGPESAASVAEFLNIPLKILDAGAEMEEKVCAPFAAAYLRGETPNPCVLCNPAVKMRALCQYADELAAEKIATGHYAKAENGAIYMGRPKNDQSYMLCRLTREQANRLVLPLGRLEKDETRALARDMGLPVSQKPDSMEICFIPNNDYAAWLEAREACPPPGDFICGGQVIGRHRGIHRYTVGQRRGFGVYADRRVYVTELNPDTNEVVLSPWEDLFTTELDARDMSWLIDEPAAPFRAKVRVRHTRWENPLCTVVPDGKGVVHISADEPLRAPAPGQSAALYDGERLLGGGFIVKRQKTRQSADIFNAIPHDRVGEGGRP